MSERADLAADVGGVEGEGEMFWELLVQSCGVPAIQELVVALWMLLEMEWDLKGLMLLQTSFALIMEVVEELMEMEGETVVEMVEVMVEEEVVGVVEDVGVK